MTVKKWGRNLDPSIMRSRDDIDVQVRQWSKLEGPILEKHVITPDTTRASVAKQMVLNAYRLHGSDHDWNISAFVWLKQPEAPLLVIAELRLNTKWCLGDSIPREELKGALKGGVPWEVIKPHVLKHARSLEALPRALLAGAKQAYKEMHEEG